MGRIRKCTSASSISSCEFVQRLEKSCIHACCIPQPIAHFCKMAAVLNVVACALNSVTYQRTRKNAGAEDL